MRIAAHPCMHRDMHCGAPVRAASRKRKVGVARGRASAVIALMQHVHLLHAGRVLFDGAFEAFVQSDDSHIAPYLSQMHMLHQRNHG